MSITVMGAGAFGSSLAQSFAKGGAEITLWGRDEQAMQELQNSRQSPRLPGVELSGQIKAVSGVLEFDTDVILLAVPLQSLRGVLGQFPDLDGRKLVACCKGIELSSGAGPVTIINEVLPKATGAILTGPSFAQDIANGLPTALTLACASDAQGADIQSLLKAPNLRIYRSSDVIGAELGGALKNVIAIACGAAIGAGLGESARAAVMTRGFAEMNRMAQHLGAQPQTLAGLAGLGDLSLTCASAQSRNFRFGQSLGQGETFDATITVEGAATARATVMRARSLNLEMPITETVVGLLDHKLDLRDAIHQLLARPAKEEYPCELP